MKQSKQLLTAILFLLALFICIKCAPIQLEMKAQNFGEITFPVDNRYDSAKVIFGRSLFFDKRLSIDSTISCVVCHKPGLAFTDGLAKSEGVLGRHAKRNSPTLMNVGFYPYFMSDGAIPTLEMQALAPIQDHNEMGFNVPGMVYRMNQIPEYVQLARKLFQRDSVDPFVVTRALAAYQRTLVSRNSRFDDYYYDGQANALTRSEKRGWTLFSETYSCTKCHSLPYFTNFKFENNGSYQVYLDRGRFDLTGKKEDIGKFKVPTLRNIELTDPYMHDGSFEYLEDVIDSYAQGGHGHPNQHEIIKSYKINSKQKKDLVNFLFSLTDKMFLAN